MDDNFFGKLHQQMLNSVFLARNPALEAARIRGIDATKIEEIVGQYAGLVTMIVSYLFMGSVRLDKFPAVRDELIRNLGEERGSLTGGLTHQEILNRELVKLGIKVNLATWDEPTRHFLAMLSRDINTSHPMRVAGVIYALEATATPELGIVGRLLNEYSRMRGFEKQLVSDAALAGQHQVVATTAEELSLDDFFCLHVDSFEPGHRDRFADAIAPELQEWEVQREFENGFSYVLVLMEAWWQKLAWS